MGGRRRHRPGEVFLSHADVDRRFAGRLADGLRRHDVRVWFSRTHLEAGQKWHDEIGRALGRCDWFVVLLSPAAVRSTWVERELTYALNHDRYNGRIVPILYRPCDFEKLSWTLGGYQMIRCGNDLPRCLEQLLRVWGVAYLP